MTRRLSLLLIFCFLSVQWFSLLHTAEYALKSDQHNEQFCSQHQHLKHSSASSPAQTSFTLAAHYLAISQIELPEAPYTHALNRHSITTRAPPSII